MVSGPFKCDQLLCLMLWLCHQVKTTYDAVYSWIIQQYCGCRGTNSGVGEPGVVRSQLAIRDPHPIQTSPTLLHHGCDFRPRRDHLE